MLWAACLLRFFEFLRSSEFTVPSEAAFDPDTHLTSSDLTLNDHQNPTILQVRLKQSKTDPFQAGHSIYIGRTDNELCPVAAMLSYLSVRGRSHGPLFQFSDGFPLTRLKLVNHLRSGLVKAKIEHSKYNGHSFRIGAATTTASCGLEDSLIQTLGRWKTVAF